MSRRPQPLDIELDIDTSPEARARYIEAIKILVRYIHEQRARAKEQKWKESES